MLLLRNGKDWDHRKVLKKNIKGKYLIFFLLNSRDKAMVRCGNLLLITNRHRIGQLDYINENMFPLWPLDINFFRHDTRIEKEIFWLTFTNVEQIRKEILKNFCFFSILLENRHQKKVFYKNNGLISLTKNSLERFLMPF